VTAGSLTQAGTAIAVNQDDVDVELPSCFYRNTLVGPIVMDWFKGTDKPMYFRDNVIVNRTDNAQTGDVITKDGITLQQSSPAAKADVSGCLHFETRAGNLDVDGSLVVPVPGKGHLNP
jgi:hypothetical protein